MTDMPYWTEHNENGNSTGKIWTKVNVTSGTPYEFYTYYNPVGNDDTSVSNSGLVAYYPFNGNANDKSGNNNDLENGGNLPQYIDDRFGRSNKAVHTTVTSEYFFLNDGYLNTIDNNKGTIAVWAKQENSGSDSSSFFMISTGTNDWATATSKAGSGRWTLKIDNTQKKVSFDVYQGTTLEADLPNFDFSQWHLYVITWDSSGRKIYVDSMLVANDSVNVLNDGGNAYDLFFMQHPYAITNSKDFGDGAIDEVRIYSRALSDSEVKQLYQETSLKFTDGDSVFEFFDDFEGTTKFSYLRGDGAYGFENSMLYITGASDGMTAFQSEVVDLPNSFEFRAAVYAYDWNEYVGFGFSKDTTLGTGTQNYDIIPNGFDWGWWGWNGSNHCIRTTSNGSTSVNDHDAYTGFYSASNGSYYYVGGKYDGNTVYHYQPTTDGTIIIDHSRTDTTWQGYNWRKLALLVWKNAKWGYDWIFIKKHSSTEPTISYDNEETGSWVFDGVEYTKRKKITVNSTETLTDYQIAMDYNQFGEDTLYITELDAPRYPYWNQDESKIWTKVSIPAGQSLTLKIDKKDPEETPIVDNGLVAWYKLNGNATDGSGNGHNGTVYGATATTDRLGNSGKAMYFDGGDDYILLPNSTSSTITSQITISHWVYVDNVNTYRPIIAKRDSAGLDYQTTVTKYDVGQKFRFNWGGSNIQGIDSDMGIETGRWYFLVTTFDGVTVKLYIDGYLNNSATTSVGLTDVASVIKIGTDNVGNYHDGKIDDLRIYNRALTDDEVWQLYTASQYHSGDLVFDFFDDFNSNSLDTNKWNNSTEFTTTNGELIMVSTTNAWHRLDSRNTFLTPYIISSRITQVNKSSSNNDSPTGMGVGTDVISSSNQGIIDNAGRRLLNTDGSLCDVQNPYFLEPHILNVAVISPTQLNISCSDGYSITRTGLNIDDPSVVSLCGYYDGSSYVIQSKWDWVFVRKYSSTEPSVSVTNQGTYYKVEITNTGTSDLNDYQVAIPISTVKYQPFEIVEAEPSPEVKKRNVIINGNVM